MESKETPMAVTSNVHDKSEKLEEYQIEVAVDKVAQIDLNKLSKEALTWKSKATWRLAVIIFVQGLSSSSFKLAHPELDN